MSHYYLGIDLGTQSVKAVVIDAATLEALGEARVVYDTDLPQYGTKDGVIRGSHEKGDEGSGLSGEGMVESPVVMFVHALDLLFTRLHEDERVDMTRIMGISGCAQQHGSVYWGPGSQSLLHELNSDTPHPQWTPSRSPRSDTATMTTTTTVTTTTTTTTTTANATSSSYLATHLASAFVFPNAPVWQDSSTASECAELTRIVEGTPALTLLTGSPAHERFTASQIMKRQRQAPQQWSQCVRISLLSSFLTSLLTGDFTALDWGDGSGMNLLDLRTHCWHTPLVHAIPGLQDKLGGPAVSSRSVAGSIARYYQVRYALPSQCSVVTATGDNLSALAGLRLTREDSACLSLGTSTTIFGHVGEPRPVPTGHVFCSPVEDSMYVPLLCVKNGALPRQHVRDECADGNWGTFDALLSSSAAGNGGIVGIYISEPEIVPHDIPVGVHCFDAQGQRIDHATLSKSQEVRAIIESQAMSLRLHSQRLGLKPRSILATGGASQSTAQLQVYANVFNAPIYTCDGQVEAAALGGALRCVHLLSAPLSTLPYEEALSQVAAAPQPTRVISPDPKAVRCYTDLLSHYEQCEQSAISSGATPH